jgi:oxalate decarboxylase
MDHLPRRNFLMTTAGLAGSAAAGAAYADFSTSQAGRLRGNDPAPRDAVRDTENSDILNSRETDHGALPKLRFPFANGHIRQTDPG